MGLMAYLDIYPLLLRKSFEFVHEDAFCHVGGMMGKARASGSRIFPS